MKYNGEYQTVVEPGVYKLRDCALLDCAFFIPADLEPEAVRIEATGYGGFGICYVRAENACGEFLPDRILKQENAVSDAGHVLENNTCFAFFGLQSAEKLFHDRSLHAVVNTLEIGLSK